jgi:hypothetical protein
VMNKVYFAASSCFREYAFYCEKLFEQNGINAEVTISGPCIGPPGYFSLHFIEARLCPGVFLRQLVDVDGMVGLLDALEHLIDFWIGDLKGMKMIYVNLSNRLAQLRQTLEAKVLKRLNSSI